MNRPRQMNAVNTALRTELVATLREVNADPSVRSIVITGAGERAFSAGQDLSESADLQPTGIPAWLLSQRAMYQAVRDLDKGCVAAINGVAVGAGFQVALCADIRVGHSHVRMGQPEVKAGFASIVGSYLMGLYVGHGVNRQLSLSGALFDGDEAYRLGFLNHVVPAEEVFQRALDEAETLAAVPTTAMRLTKERFRMLTQPGFDDANVAVIRYMLEAYASGEPQEVQASFLAARGRDRDGERETT